MDNLTHSSAVSIYENSNLDLVVYPNPVSEALNVNASFSEVDITITNIQGQTVKTVTNFNTLSSIDVTDLIPGFYHVSFTSYDGTVTKKFQKL